MAEPVDALVSNTNTARCAGSTPAPGIAQTKTPEMNLSIAAVWLISGVFLSECTRSRTTELADESGGWLGVVKRGLNRG